MKGGTYMAISSINNNTNDTYKQLSTMKKINSASDNAAGLAISQKMESQKNGYDVGKENALTSKDFLQVAEGGLSQINDSLQRIKELGIKASNGIYTNEDKAMIQEEINGLKATIQDAAKGTEFNTLKPLDGSMADMNLALNPDGTGMKIQLESSTLEALGIEDFDVTKDFDLSTIDSAIEKVNQGRSNIGAKQNALEFASSANEISSQNLTSAKSRVEDLDVGKAVSDMQKEKVLDEYKRYAMLEQVKNGSLDVNKMLGL